jgi:hypothetical protein
MGGWTAPSGYARLPGGLYTATNSLTTNYLVGAGVLVVPPPQGAVFKLW